MTRERALKCVLVVAGSLFLCGAYSLTEWHRPDLACEQMFGSVYATLGLFLLLAMPNPSSNRTLIAFAGWSSVVHAAVMTLQSCRHLISHDEFVKSAPVLAAIGIALLVLGPRQADTVHA